MSFARPKYLEGLTGDDLRIATCRFLIRLAALHYSPEGHINKLSEKLGMSPNSLATLSTITPEVAVKLEAILGRERFPRELFRPDIFVTAEAASHV